MQKLFSILLVFSLLGCSERKAADHLTSAKAQIKQQKYHIASIELKNAIKKEPELGEARFLLAKIYMAELSYDNAQKEFERALEFNYPASEIALLLAQTYHKNKASQALLQLSIDNLSLNTDALAEIYYYKSQAMIRLEQAVQAKELMNKIKTLDTQSPFKSLAHIHDLLEDNNTEEANTRIDAVLAKHPILHEGLKLKGHLQLQTGNTSGAITTYRIYTNYYPEDLDYIILLANLLTHAGKNQEAETIVNLLLEIDSKNSLIYLLKSIIRFSEKDNTGALLFAEKSLSLAPYDIPARLIAGVSAYLLNNFEKANQHLSFIANKLPSNHQALRVLADSQLQLGLSLEANNTVAKFDEILAQDTPLITNIGRSLLHTGEINKAKALLKIQPESINTMDTFASMGMLKLSLNDLSGIIDLEKSLNNFDKNTADLPQVEIEATLAQAYFYTGQLDKVMSIAQKWQLTDKHYLQGLILAAKVHTAQNNNAKAKSLYLQALKQNPKDPEISLALINLQPINTIEEKQKAFNDVSALLNKHPKNYTVMLNHYFLGKALNKDTVIVTHLKKLLQEEPNNKTYQITLAKIHVLENEQKEAIKWFELAKTEEPKSFWLLLAQAYVQAQQFDEAISLYKKWFNKQPNHPKAVAGMIKAHMAKGELEQAFKISQRYLNEIGGSDNEVRLLNLQLLLNKENFKLAEKELSTLPENIKLLPFSRGILGQIELEKKELTSAKRNFTIAYQAAPSSINANIMFKIISLAENESSAIYFLKKHITEHPDDELNTLKYALLQERKSSDDALTYYHATLKINPKNTIALNNAANIYINKKQWENAYEYALNAYKIEPNAIHILDTLGTIELKLNKVESALVHLSQAIKLSNDKINEFVFVNYIEALLRNEQYELAAKKINQHPIKNKTAIAKLTLLKNEIMSKK